VNVAPAQLHPNSWAFVRAFAILCYSLGLTSFVDTYLYFIVVKDPAKKLMEEAEAQAHMQAQPRVDLGQP